MTAPPNSPAIRAEGLTKRFGKKQALAGVDLEAAPGTVLGVLGPNGAGKTTTVRVLSTLLRPDSGRAWMAGHDVLADPEAVRRDLGLSGQYAAVDEKLTGRENLYLVARLYGFGRHAARRRAGQLLSGFDLEDAADLPSGTYSGGMRRRLDLAGALVARPAVVVLDEPTTGLDPRGRADTWQAVRDLVAEGTTVLLTTQYLEEADQLADAIVVIEGGHVVARGSAAELKARVGGERLSLTVSDPRHRVTAAEILAALGEHLPDLDPRTGRLTVATDHGAQSLEYALGCLRLAGIAVRDVELAPPTLDDVFLSLTGRPLEPGRPPVSPTASTGATATGGDGR
ncbi:ATP-binding cassette domain-containing protein [Streptomyces sp. CA-278952]|uniref:ATP-binding cassette domain-containing protein n=1 Tax=unclassified Streptomyces TaxID=2593676 RepID=UPI002242AA12|nr:MULTISPECIES: ATP-binding cassette domain-containing protein [unclassified Streptomyces]UZI27855.1 ATP-binding cassette domain-containing protein [Streptomyces sp. VB1]WDG28047.1 ATP-binding cassette domain-containing protein [Streptomyces sp. CA-278952]